VRQRLYREARFLYVGVARTGAAALRVRNHVTAAVRGLKWPEWKVQRLGPDALLERCLAEADHFSRVDEEISNPMEEEDYEKLRLHSELVRKDRRVVYSSEGGRTTRLETKWQHEGLWSTVGFVLWHFVVLPLLSVAVCALVLPAAVPLALVTAALVALPWNFYRLAVVRSVVVERETQVKSLLDC